MSYYRYWLESNFLLLESSFKVSFVFMFMFRLFGDAATNFNWTPEVIVLLRKRVPVLLRSMTVAELAGSSSCYGYGVFTTYADPYFYLF